MIAVLGRGESLKRFLKFQIGGVRYRKIYLVNSFEEECDLIGLSIYSAEHIIHICGRKGASVMGMMTYEKLNIKRVVSNAINHKMISNIKRHRQAGTKPECRPEFMNDRGYPPLGWDAILEGKTKGKLKSKNGRSWPTTGIYAIDLALMEHRHTPEIHLFGFDFYEEHYMVKKNRPYQHRKNPKMKVMKLYMEKLVREFDRTQFYCYSKFKLEYLNWNNA